MGAKGLNSRLFLPISCDISMSMFKLGKLPKKVDARTLQLKSFLMYKNLPPLPDIYDVDSAFANFSNNHMFGNDTYGDCVIAGRAHMTLRFEEFEENKLLPVTDSEVTTEYFKETGGFDSGLVMLNSLNEWRKSGWTVAGKTYDIHAYAEIDKNNHNELKYTVLLLRGAYTGFSVPQSAIDQFDAGKSWTVVNGSPIIGGHCVYIKAYNATGPICVTWGRDQQMTWGFWDTYFDEAYGVIDNRNIWCDPATDPLNLTELDAQLAEITSSPPNPTPPTPSPCQVGNGFAKIANLIPWILHRKGRFYYLNPPTDGTDHNTLKRILSTITVVGSVFLSYIGIWQFDLQCFPSVWGLSQYYYNGPIPVDVNGKPIIAEILPFWHMPITYAYVMFCGWIFAGYTLLLMLFLYNNMRYKALQKKLEREKAKNRNI